MILLNNEPFRAHFLRNFRNFREIENAFADFREPPSSERLHGTFK
jgi:hypothetical protein